MIDYQTLFNKLRSVCLNAICEITLMDDISFKVRFTWRVKRKGKEDVIPYIDRRFDIPMINMKPDYFDYLLNDTKYLIIQKTKQITILDDNLESHETIKLLFGREDVSSIIKNVRVW